MRVPSDLARARVTVQLLPKGSPKFLSDAQLRALVERTAKVCGPSPYEGSDPLSTASHTSRGSKSDFAKRPLWQPSLAERATL